MGTGNASTREEMDKMGDAIKAALARAEEDKAKQDKLGRQMVGAKAGLAHLQDLLAVRPHCIVVPSIWRGTDRPFLLRTRLSSTSLASCLLSPQPVPLPSVPFQTPNLPSTPVSLAPTYPHPPCCLDPPRALLVRFPRSHAN